MAGSRCQALSNELVQKSLTQLHELEGDSYGYYMQPLAMLEAREKEWDSLVKGLSAEEVADLENARDEINRYKHIYNIFDMCSELNEHILVLETRIASNNVTIPMSSYRYSESNSAENLFPEIETCLNAYYELIDDCQQYPDWKFKVE